MRIRTVDVVAALLCLGLLSLTTHRAMAGDDDKGDKQKQKAAEKVEIKDLPTAVTDAAKKELPNANWTSAAKHSTKKQGTAYALEGTEGKFHVTLMLSSSGELLRFTKVAGRKKAK